MVNRGPRRTADQKRGVLEVEVAHRRRLWIGCGPVAFGIALVVFRAGPFEDAILDLQLRLPRNPVALFGNGWIIASPLFLVASKGRWGRKG